MSGERSDATEATVIFADISGFTAVSETLDPEAVTDLMNACFGAFEGIILAHGGRVDQYLGDCVVAVFGLGEAGTSRGAARAAQASLDIRAAMTKIAQEMPEARSLGIHVGIATGPVLAGEIGGSQTRAFTVRGPAVEQATQLEDLSEPGEILVGERACTDLRDAFELRPRASGRVDGRAVFELTGVVRGRGRARRPSERREATVLFADLVGFAAVVAGRSPEEARALLNRCFSILERAVLDFGGTVDKYLGEGMMALFGVPNAIERAPQQALNAAIETRRRLAAFASEEGLPLDLRIAVNTGLVIAGEIGGRARRDFTVMGDTVNLAARLKAAAPVGTTYVGPETHRATRREFEFRALAPMRVKGKVEPVAVFELRSQTAQVHRARTGAPRRPRRPRPRSSAACRSSRRSSGRSSACVAGTVASPRWWATRGSGSRASPPSSCAGTAPTCDSSRGVRSRSARR